MTKVLPFPAAGRAKARSESAPASAKELEARRVTRDAIEKLREAIARYGIEAKDLAERFRHLAPKE